MRSPMHQPDGLPRGVQIAECTDSYFQPFTAEAKANARLISAAPELLDALKEIIDAADGGGWKAIDPSFGKARAAIAKATGGAA